MRELDVRFRWKMDVIVDFRSSVDTLPLSIYKSLGSDHSSLSLVPDTGLSYLLHSFTAAGSMQRRVTLFDRQSTRLVDDGRLAYPVSAYVTNAVTICLRALAQKWPRVR
jgi:hypothetical protein